MTDKIYGDIPPLLELERRCLTVGELRGILEDYPEESLVHIFREHLDGKTRPFMEIKEVTPVFDQQSGQASPGLVLGEISVKK